MHGYFARQNKTRRTLVHQPTLEDMELIQPKSGRAQTTANPPEEIVTTFFNGVYRDKTILVTGHTGFKGSWLCEWLIQMGARVVGFSLDVPTEPSHFVAIGLGERLAADLRGDVRSLDAIQAAIHDHSPDFLFHLA